MGCRQIGHFNVQASFRPQEFTHSCQSAQWRRQVFQHVDQQYKIPVRLAGQLFECGDLDIAAEFAARELGEPPSRLDSFGDMPRQFELLEIAADPRSDFEHGIVGPQVGPQQRESLPRAIPFPHNATR